MSKNYSTLQKECQAKLRQSDLQLFNNDVENGILRGHDYDFVLQNWINNLFEGIREKMPVYCKSNDIAIHFGSPHLASSFIACLNHLFPLRSDKNAVLSIAKIICPDFTEVLPMKNDKDGTQGYISFEVVSNTDHLNESLDGQKLTRGTMCTSVDACILAKKQNDVNTYLVPIEWKYTESYGNEDKSNGDDGIVRLGRYSNLITNSKQLKPLDNYKSSVYFFEPFYQLMRQTLWAEQMIANKATEIIKADDFIHVHVIPNGNHNLLRDDLQINQRRIGYMKGAKTSLIETWTTQLGYTNKYKIIDPKVLLQNIDKQKYSDLLTYLKTRYWQ
ncbi:hypothetical protein FACS189421_01190 [Bacteroidia bacterium]|nr:hypothetical protein FACS189421_01190 [Bacteroidia bacterium]GHT04535.1 hypothetical protein FACS189423_07360 [Bacteroidia bacterium]GHT46122.1 hypothetical protein FACS189440_03480 [Bacteroidia bacterium]